MKLYFVDDGDRISWWGTLREAQQEGRRTAPVFRGAVRITETYIRTDKGGLLSLLTAGAPVVERRGRSWKLSARGALRLFEDPGARESAST